jgi:hypothetical protein
MTGDFSAAHEKLKKKEYIPGHKTNLNKNEKLK